MKSFILPGFITLFGICWMLESADLIPQGQVLWVALLAAAGVSSFLVWGLKPQGIQWGPFFLICAVCAVLRMQGVLTSRLEIPMLIAVFGLCMTISRLPAVQARATPPKP
jgi:tryptophan-rich sensory protein